MLGRRGPAQAAFTNPEVRELGELTDADIVIDPAEVELDPASRRLPRVATTATPRTAATSRSSPSSPQREPEGKPQADRAALPAARRSRSRATARSSVVLGHNELYVDESRRDPRPRHRRARDDRVRPRAALDRLHGHPARGPALRRAPRRDPQRGRPGHSTEDGEQVPGHYAVGWIKRGPSGVIGTNKKDAAGDGRQPARGPRRGTHPAARPARRDDAADADGGGRGALTSARRARPRPRQLPRLAGDRRAPRSPRRAPRPPAGQVLPRRRDGRGRGARPGPRA